MALTLRTLTNHGEPLCDQSGKVLADTKITFTLIDKFGNPRDVFDATTGERVASVTQTVTTDREGMFSINLFPTSRADSKVYYLCKVDNPGISDIFAPLVEGEDSITWSTFKQAAGNIDPNEISAFALHVSDNAKHLTPEQNDAMESASNPSAVNPFATMTDIIVAGGGHGIQDDGLNLTQQPNINFTGDGVTVTSDAESGAIVVAISGASAGDAGTNLKGISKLSVAPVDPTNPIAVGTNDPRMSDARTPLSHGHTLGTITDVTITPANLNSLDDGTDTSLHYHMSDRNRSNHTGTQVWTTVSKSGSKLTDMADVPAPVAGKAFKRRDDDTGYEWADISGLTNHENLAGLQGGGAGDHSHLTAAQVTALTGGNNTTAHYHTADRSRANHSGTQTASTISDFQTTVSANTDVAASVTHNVNTGVHVSATEKAALVGTGIPSSTNKFVTQDTLASGLSTTLQSSGVAKFTAAISSPASPSIGDLWHDTNFNRSSSVVFAGASATLSYYTLGFAQMLTTNLPLDFPTQSFSFYNEGVGGTSSQDWSGWVSSKITVHSPSIVTLMLGTNDSKDASIPGNHHVDIGPFSTYMQQIIDAVKASGAKLILITPTPVNESSSSPATGFTDAALLPYVQAVRTLASTNHLPLVDAYNVIHAYYNTPRYNSLYISDGIHLTDEGYRLVYSAVYSKINDIVGNVVKRWDGYNWAATANQLPQAADNTGGVRGSWKSTLTYQLNDIVTYNGNSYICNRSNLNTIPSTDSGTYWSIYAKNVANTTALSKVATTNSYNDLDDKPLATYAAKQMGIKCDGVTDDTDAIDAATTAINAAGGGILEFPVGTCIARYIKLRKFVHLQGQSTDTSVLKLKDGTNANFIVLDDATTSGGTSTVDWSMTRLRIDGNRTNNSTGHAIYLRGYGAPWSSTAPVGQGFKHQIIDDILVIEAAEDGIHADGMWWKGITLMNSNISRCNGRGIFWSSNDGMMMNLWVHTCQKAGLYFYRDSSSVGIPGNVRLTNVKGWNNNRGKTDQGGFVFKAAPGYQFGFCQLNGTVSQEVNDDYAYWFEGVTEFCGQNIQYGNSNTYEPGLTGASRGIMLRNCTAMNLKTNFAIGAGGNIPGASVVAHEFDGGRDIKVEANIGRFSDWGATGTVTNYSLGAATTNLHMEVNGVNVLGTQSADTIVDGNTNKVYTASEQTKLASIPSSFATVATSGSYTDLSNIPILANVATSGNYSDLSGRPTLAAVAASGSYSDLSNKPIIPAAQVQPDWNAVSGMGKILNQPTLAPVAISGSYGDLSGKPSIPTNTNQLTNGAGFITPTTVGTLAPSSDTTSSVQITNASGTPIVVVDTTNGNVGIATGTTTPPAFTFEVAKSSSTAAAAIGITTYTQGAAQPPTLALRQARGTIAAPLRTKAGDTLGLISGCGAYAADDTSPATFASSPRARIAFYASEDYTSTANGTEMRFETTAKGTTSRTEKARMYHDGGWQLGGTFPASDSPTSSSPGAGNMIIAGKLGIGTTAAPAYHLDIQDTTGATGQITIASNNGTTIAVRGYIDSATTRPVISGNKARGTLAVPAAVQTGDKLGTFSFGGHDGASFQTGAAIDFYANGTVASGSVPADIVLVTGSSSGSRTDKVRIFSSGGVAIKPSVLATDDPGAGNIFASGFVTAKHYVETSATPSAVSNVFTPDISAGSTCIINLGSTNTIANPNPAAVPASGLVASITLVIKQDSTGGRTVSWGSAYKWGDAGVPTLSSGANKTTIITCITYDGGSTWLSFLSGTGF